MDVAPKISDGLTSLLTACVNGEASDLHLAPGQLPLLRVNGTLIPIAGQSALSVVALDGYAHELLGSGRNNAILAERGDCDGALTAAGARFRFNIFRRGGGLCIAVRRLEERFRSLKELGLPEVLYDLCDLRDGLIIVAGPTGAGKSTTLAALIDRINQRHSSHIITIEDPVEYVHTPVRGLVNQRQIGTDCPEFHDALVASLRQDPDVILVGEIRELNTVRTAISAAETGHLVFTTVHAGDCVGVIERLVAVFPAGEQEGIRRQLSLVLRAVIAQRLIIRDGSTGANELAPGRRPRVAASEVLMVNGAVANLIASGKSSQIYSAMEIGSAQGMQTLEHDLARLLGGGIISEETALALARSPNTLRERVNRFRAQAGGRNYNSATTS